MYFSQRTSRAAICTVGFLLVLVISLISGVGTSVLAAPRTSSTRHQMTKNTAANTAVTTYKEDSQRTGNHNTETILTTNNVNNNAFGKRMVYPTDGQIYTQPLFLSNVTIAGTSHNVAYVTTEHDSVYAFDADQTGSSTPLWYVNFTNPPNVVAPSNTDQ